MALEAPVQHRLRIRRAGAAVAVALTAAACGGASDQPSPSPLPVAATTSSPASTASPSAPAAPEVSADEAMTIALDAVGGGEVQETDVDEFEVVIQVWEVTVVTPEGGRRQVSIDMRNGSIIGNEADD
jgi:ABC-type glycerol-3-phosphate transport system substrate-binding protein